MNDNKLNIRIGEKDLHQHYSQRSSPNKTFPWGILVFALIFFVLTTISGIIAWQLAPQFDTAKLLQHRWLQTICVHLDCRWLHMPPSYQAVQLKNIRFVQHGNNLVFSGHLINRAHALPWPILELALYGVDGRNMHRYRLLPQDYLLEKTSSQMLSAEYAIGFSVKNPAAAVSYTIEFIAATAAPSH